MFANACEKAYKFTRPLIVSTRTVGGTVSAAVGTFFFVNSDGWAMTAGHMFDSFVKFQGDLNKIKEIDGINESKKAAGPDGVSIEQLNKLEKDQNWITNHSFWFGQDGIRMSTVFVNRQVDIAIMKLEGVKPEMVSEFPVFRDPATMRPGTSLCRLGFPFVNVESDFDAPTNSFRIKKGVLPLPFFPNDGIHTRNLNGGKSKDGFDLLYVETSTPGLKGQSGGPIFDAQGRIYAMQVRTNHIPLGFHPTAEYEGKVMVENQFINVGVAVHGKVIQDILRSKNVRFNTDTKDSNGDVFVIN